MRFIVFAFCIVVVSAAKLGSPADEEITAEGDSATGVIFGAKLPGEHDNIRVEVELVQLLNPQSVTWKKESCDFGSACDTWIYGTMDTDNPTMAWPGSKGVDRFNLLWSGNNVDSPILNKIAQKDICGGLSITKVNFRVHVVDEDITSNTEMEDFECLFAADYRKVARDVSSAEWSAIRECKPFHSGHNIRLQYRYRICDVPRDQCTPGESAGTPQGSGTKFQLVLIQ